MTKMPKMPKMINDKSFKLENIYYFCIKYELKVLNEKIERG